MNKYFDLASYKELLKFKVSYENSYSFFDEKNLKLLNYEVSVIDQITYDRKAEYFLLIQNYLIGLIHPFEFRDQFLAMIKQDNEKASIILNDFKQLEVFLIADDLNKITNFINEISEICFGFYESWDGTIILMSEIEFYYFIKITYSQFQKVLLSNYLKLSYQNKKYNSLILRSFNILRFSLGSFILLILFSINIIEY